jgi:1,4-alpha-glucan branching enzyme
LLLYDFFLPKRYPFGMSIKGIRHLFLYSLCATLMCLGVASGATAQHIVFRYKNPKASAVALAGEFTNWARVPMKKDKDGVWTYRVRLRQGTYLYNFIVDGRGILDPLNKHSRQYGDNEASVIVINGKDPRTAH